MTSKERQQRTLENAKKRFFNCLKQEEYDGALRIAIDYVMKDDLYRIEELRSKLKLSDEEIEGLHSIETTDPHFAPSGPKTFYLRIEANRIVYKKNAKNIFKNFNHLRELIKS